MININKDKKRMILLIFEWRILDLLKTSSRPYFSLIGLPILLAVEQGGPNITANLYCICLNEHETYAYADAVQNYGNI